MSVGDATGVAVVGCGLIGGKRAAALGPLRDQARLVACADVDLARAQALARPASAVATARWQEVVERADVDLVVVATRHDSLAEVTTAAARAGKHVLVEKPAARRADELLPALAAAREAKVRVRVGFNHRYHPALLKARELVAHGALGPLMFLRARYGHGGRVGYEKEWRADPALSGGGELIDQGVHLIDLARMFLGDLPKVQGFAPTYYWDMPVDDNAFLLLRTADDKAAFLHASCTEWRNLFSLEVYGETGKLAVDGLGGSYGLERLTYYRMLPELGPPETTAWEYPRGDESWRREVEALLEDIRLGREPDPGLPDAIAALRIVEQVYAAGEGARP